MDKFRVNKISKLVLVLITICTIISMVYSFCNNMWFRQFPCPAMGIDLMNWKDGFYIDLVFIFLNFLLYSIVPFLVFLVTKILIYREGKKNESMG